MENLTVNLSREEVLKYLNLWSDIGVLPLVVTRHDKKYGAGTLKFIYDKVTNVIHLKGLSNQDFTYKGTLDNFLNQYKVWSA